MRGLNGEVVLRAVLPVLAGSVAVLARRRVLAARSLRRALSVAEASAVAEREGALSTSRAVLAGGVEERVREHVASLRPLTSAAALAVRRRDAVEAERALGAVGEACEDVLAALRELLDTLPAAAPGEPSRPTDVLAAVLPSGARVRGDAALTPPGQQLAAARLLESPGFATGRVAVRHEPGRMRVVVRGRGRGPALLGDPIAIAGLRARVAAHDGVLRVSDAPWSWSVRIELPSRPGSLLLASASASLDERRADALLAAFASAIVLLDVAALRVPSPAVSAALGVGTAALPLAVRRRYPLAVCASSAAGMVVGALAGVLPRRVAAYFEITVVPFAAAAHAVSRRRAVAGVGVLTAGGVVAEAVLGARPRELAALTAYGSLAGAVAWLARHSHGRALSLAVSADELRRSHPEALARALGQERSRVARDLHDLVGHGITLAAVVAGGAAAQASTGQWAAAERSVTALEEALLATRDELDRLVRALRTGPAEPAAASLEDIRRVVDQARRAGQVVSLTVGGHAGGGEAATPRTDTIGLAVRTVQEALTNARRHGGGASTVRVDVGEAVAVDIVNRHGPSAGRTLRGSGRGLAGLRREAAALGGTLEAGREGGAFVTRLRLP